MNYVLGFLPALFTDELTNETTSSSRGSYSSVVDDDNRPVEAILYYFGGRGRADQLRFVSLYFHSGINLHVIILIILVIECSFVLSIKYTN